MQKVPNIAQLDLKFWYFVVQTKNCTKSYTCKGVVQEFLNFTKWFEKVVPKGSIIALNPKKVKRIQFLN